MVVNYYGNMLSGPEIRQLGSEQEARALAHHLIVSETVFPATHPSPVGWNRGDCTRKSPAILWAKPTLSIGRASSHFKHYKDL